MQGLCTKVMKGVYPSIPSIYSKDLSSMISTLLQVSPSKRPSCSQILHMPAIDEHLNEEENYEICQELLNTIKFPRNIKHLNNRLPKSQYTDEIETQPSEEKKVELVSKNSQPLLPEAQGDNFSEEMKKEIAKYEAIAEIERKYGNLKSTKGKRQRQIPKTTPSSINGIPEMYVKYKDKARGIAESKKNYLVIKEKYAKRAKEVEQIEQKEKILLHKRVTGGPAQGQVYDSPGLYKRRANYHYDIPKGRNQHSISHLNSKSEECREGNLRANGIRIKLIELNYHMPETSKAVDNLYIEDRDARKQRILQHAREIRAAVSQNREKATGMVKATDQSMDYKPQVPKWWG
uniref:non-specific serine/threonine protein kinase n=1 Tax=Euplotes harpa TaxID=151035 RepID=A0A7S3NB87_9SPIT|mmetsp:Transcript_32692/g.37336  ORF Transcript_32692/g.37336 Transcript_32692/m.37336 type:complete len:347 (+) Transcript_32692:346-1386(+)